MRSRGIKHFSTDANLGKLKSEFTNLHLKFKNHSKITILGEVLEFFKDAVKCELNWELLAPNAVKFLMLVMIHPSITVTYKRSFRLSKLIKTNILSTMNHHRFNHLLF